MNPTHIVIHNSATKDSGSVSWGAIRKYHMAYVYRGRIITEETAKILMGRGERVKKPWSDIGYHFGIELVGDNYEILAGRMPNKQGAHCRAAGMNRKAIGICCVGDYDGKQPPFEMLQKLEELVKYLMGVYGIPKCNIIGHGEVEPRKTCPGRMFNMLRFRGRFNKL